VQRGHVASRGGADLQGADPVGQLIEGGGAVGDVPDREVRKPPSFSSLIGQQPISPTGGTGKDWSWHGQVATDCGDWTVPGWRGGLLILSAAVWIPTGGIPDRSASDYRPPGAFRFNGWRCVF
jgi:hypothetical protein